MKWRFILCHQNNIAINTNYEFRIVILTFCIQKSIIKIFSFRSLKLNKENLAMINTSVLLTLNTSY